MDGLLLGYARVSAEEQDLTAQRDGLARLGVEPSRSYVDHGLTGTNRDRPGLREALAACPAGDTLVVTKLDRLARSLPDARTIAEDLTRHVRPSLGGSVYDPTDPAGRPLFNVLAMVAEFQADLIRSRTKGRHAGRESERPPTGQAAQAQPTTGAHLVELIRSGECTTSEVGDLFGVARSTVYRALQRSKQRAALTTTAKATATKAMQAHAGIQRATPTPPQPTRTQRPATGRGTVPENSRPSSERHDHRGNHARNRHRIRDADHLRRQAAQAADRADGLRRKAFGLRNRSNRVRDDHDSADRYPRHIEPTEVSCSSLLPSSAS
jgi:DNA invertase Pin-like site-specific DNA recombinase